MWHAPLVNLFNEMPIVGFLASLTVSYGCKMFKEIGLLKFSFSSGASIISVHLVLNSFLVPGLFIKCHKINSLFESLISRLNSGSPGYPII
jgi:hypothetical protein